MSGERVSRLKLWREILHRNPPPPWLGLLIAVVPAILLLPQIVLNWVNIPWGDEWDTANVRIKFHDGALSTADLFAQHNEHRFFFARLLWAPLARVTHWDLRVEMLLTFAAACLISWLLWKLLGNIPRLERHARVTAFLIVNSLLFSPTQYETWLWGINFTHIIPPLLLLVSLRVNLSRRSLPEKVVLNILLCSVSTFSNSNGMGNWLLAFPAFAPGRAAENKSRWPCYVLYVAAAAAVLAAYFWDYHRPPHHPSLLSALAMPWQLAHYFFCWLGASVAVNFGFDAWIAGAGLLILFAKLACYPVGGWSESWRARYPFVVLGAFALLSGSATALGRTAFDSRTSLSSHYITSSVYFPIALVGVATVVHATRGSTAGQNQRGIIALPIITVTVVWVLFLSTYYSGWQGMKRTKNLRVEGQAALAFQEIIPDNPQLELLYPDRDWLLRQYGELRRCGLIATSAVPRSLVSKLVPDANPNVSSGSIETCRFERNKLRLNGWAVDEFRQPAPFVLFTYRTDEVPAVPFAVAPTGRTTRRLERKGLRNRGFNVRVRADLLPQGAEVIAWAVDPARSRVWQIGPPRFAQSSRAKTSH
ncbi:MAG: hypothetical protein ABR589_09460 [Chthoniobacterales bacterium]